MASIDILSDRIRRQIARAIKQGYRRFNMYDLDKHYFACEQNGDHLNILLVERDGQNYQQDVCWLSDLYFSHGCAFLRFVLGERQYLDVARFILPSDDGTRLLNVHGMMYNVEAYGADPTGVTDSREAIQQALHDGSGFFPPGTHPLLHRPANPRLDITAKKIP